MADARNNGEWEDWGDENDTPGATVGNTLPPSSPQASSASNEPSAASQDRAEPPKSRRELLDWEWDLAEIDAELAALAPSSDWIPTVLDKQRDGPSQALHALASLAGPTRVRLGELGERTRAMRAQTAVAQWRLQRLANGISAPSGSEDLAAVEHALTDLAGDWARAGSTNETHETTTSLDEMSRLLQHALDACDDGDMAPFQQALEQLFASLPDQRLVVPTAWIRPPSAPTEPKIPDDASFSSDAFVAQLVVLCDDDGQKVNRVRSLAEAQVFQDTKDIQRDEVVVNGEHVVGGAIGYDAVVDTIERHLRNAITQASQKTEDVETILRHAAQLVLTACNRTESGGCSFEILSQFVTQHATDRVLIRPASARAPPLGIAMDVGAFATDTGGWCFGLRVVVSAVTWYCICDSDDPTRELFDVETTYTNRLAFPLGLTPLTPRDLLRRDAGDVAIRLRVESQDPNGDGSEYYEGLM